MKWNSRKLEVLIWVTNKLVNPYKYFQSQDHVKKKWPAVVACLILISCLVVMIIQCWIFSPADPLWSWTRACHAHVYWHAKFECHSLNQHLTIILIVQVNIFYLVWDAVVTLSEGQGHQTEKRLYRPLVRLSWQQPWWALLEQSKIIEHLWFSWLRSVWPWINVKVNIINMWCLLVTEAITLSNL